jgi:4-hydroxyphenylacetate 3-monooxygenase
MAKIKTGGDHLESLRDEREIYLQGKRVGDPTIHPAYRNSCATAARLYDFQSDPANVELMTFESPDKKGVRVNRAWQLPLNYVDLVQRRRALEAWAGLHYGFMGRSPDHVASCFSGMLMGIEVFEAYDSKRAAALRDYFCYARDRDLFLTYVIINPQADRSKATGEQADQYLAAGVVDEDASGITIRGAKMLATSGIMANEVFVSCLQPLQKGEERYAISVAVPMNIKGLKILSRKSYELAAPSVFDNPLSSRFDENDAVVYFDDVKVPWERVFVNQNTEMMQKQAFATPAHYYQNYQCMVRCMVKLRFLLGIAHKIGEANGIIAFPQVKETLGMLASEAGLVEGMVYGMEAKGQHVGPYFVPDKHLLYSALVLAQQLYGKIISTLRELSGGGVIMLPSGIEDFANPELARIIDKTQKSPVYSSEDRVKFFKLAWDAIGSEFASRHSQYEMFYAAPNFVNKGHSFRTYDWKSATGMVDTLMNSYALKDELKDASAVDGSARSKAPRVAAI